MTDENGIVCYEKPYDGSTSDQEMDEDAIRYLSETVDASSSTIVADCKIATKPLVDLMFEVFCFLAISSPTLWILIYVVI